MCVSQMLLRRGSLASSVDRRHDERATIRKACVSIAVETIDEANGVSLKDYLSLLEKIKRSVERHSEDGTRGYYEFVRRYVT